MKTKTLNLAVEAAKRFVLAAEKAKQAINRYSSALPDHLEHGKDAASAKRASMDLTRALADLQGGK